MTTTILLIRHGQTDWNLTKRAQGHIDQPLNDTGRQQSERLAARLAGWPIAAIYSSDLRRASETAAIVGRKHALAPLLDVAFRERNGGIFEGHTAEEQRRLYPDELRAFLEFGQPPPGVESNLDLARRATPALERIAGAHPGEMIALVSHGGTLRVIIAYWLGLPVGRKPPLRVSGNTGLTIFELSETGPTLTLLNDCCHLDRPDGRFVDNLATGQGSSDGDYTIG
jgi:broad specificity phosphatase PhoE